MPNHYTTIAICSPGHDFDVNDFNGRHADSNLCAIAKPIPEPLEDIHVGHHGKLGVTRWRETEDGPVPVDEADLKARFGHADWYEWANEHWGTKWGTYDCKAYPLGGDGAPIAIKFQSAWGPPTILNEIAAWLCRTYGFEKVAFVGFDPCDDSTKMLTTGDATTSSHD